MGLHRQVQGVGPKGGIFWAGRPTTMLVLDDGIVFLQASTLASILGAQGAVGPLIQAAKQHRDAKRRDAVGDELTGEDFREQKRATVIGYDELAAARLEGGKRARKLSMETPDGPTHLKFGVRTWPDEDSVPFLAGKLGDRFANAVG